MNHPSQHSASFLRKRKFLLVLPLLVIPFVCIVFAALGGGPGAVDKAPAAQESKGFNMNLPGAHFAPKEKLVNKLEFYKKADEDSVRLLERIRQDPYHLKTAVLPGTRHLLTSITAPPPEDSTANQLLKQLDKLKQVLHRPAISAPSPASIFSTPEANLPSPHLPELNRLNALMQAVKAADTASSAIPQISRKSSQRVC